MNKNIEQLNRQLGNALGYAHGNSPRFAWMWAPEVYYYYRQHLGASWERICWAERVGKVWMLCQWRRPDMPESEWWSSFHGEFPYPMRGMYYAQPETALPPFREPTADITQWYIRSIAAQMDTTFREQYDMIQDRLDRQQKAADDEWVAMVQNDNPAFSNERLTPALHGANVEFQVGGQRAQIGAA